ncbi:MAG: phage tail tape measure protein [Lachnospiraceae bacterium]|nr:phage tail tape measure protein [Butyrivibrio sp.]MCM1344028.1 phage tail tape measure protein [Muribaculaceae bacterium]MCM1411505.1 phage tail tape measure protein [Lachnospiraceae bacterium]
MDLFTLVGRIILDAGDFDDRIDDAMSKVESLAGGLQKAGDKISQIGGGLTKAVTLPLTALGGVSVNAAASFEDAMLKVQSLSGASREEYEQLSTAAKEYGATTAWTAKDVAEAMGYMALAGFDTKEILASTSGMLSLASASGEDLATVTDILTDSMTAFGDGAGDASRYADVLATTQAKTNTTVGLLGEAFKYVAPLAGSYSYRLEDVAAALGMMANAGVKGSMSGTALSSIITRLGTNTNGARDAVEELGVEFYNSDGTARNLSDVLKDLCDATARMDTEQKAALANVVAGMEAQKGLLAILNQGSAAYEELEGKIKSCDGTASDMAQNMESGLGGSLRSLKSALEGVTITIGEKLAPYIEKGAQKIKEFTQWFQNLDAGTQDTIIKMGLLLVASGPVLTIFGKGVSMIGSIISVGSKLVGGIGTVISVGSKLISGAGTLVGAITSLNPVVLAVAAAIAAVVAIGVTLYKNWDTIKEKAHELGEKISRKWNEIKQWTSDLKDSIVEKWNNIKEGISNAVENVKEAVTGKFEELKEKASSKVEELKESASTKFEELKEKASGKVEELKEKATAKFEELKEKASSKVEELKEKAAAKFEELKEKAASKVEDLKEKAVSRFEEMKEKTASKVSEMREKVVTDFSNLKEQVSNKISDLKERWGQRFEEAREKIVSEVTTLKENATNKIEEFRQAAVSKVAEFKDAAVQRFSEFKDSSVSSLAEVARKGVEGFNNIRDKGSAAIENLKSVAANKFADMGNAIHDKFSFVSDKITGTFSKCQEKVRDIVDKIKSFFDFEWELPHIKLPHFSISGRFSLNPPSIPHIGVEWYAKGGVMTRPTAFGMNPVTGNMMAGGEAGAEAIAPIAVLQDYIRQAVAERDQGLISSLTAILNTLNRYLPQYAERQLVLDTGATVGALAAGMNTRLGEISRQDERIR